MPAHDTGGRMTDPRFIIAYTIIVFFVVAYFLHPSETMAGALIAAFAGSWGYWLGSSRGASQLNDNIGKVADAVTAAANASPPAEPPIPPTDPAAPAAN